MTDSFSAGELSNGTVSNAESIVLETSSSFGSTSSSASSSSTTNLSSIKAQVEDSKLTLPSSDSFTRYTYIFCLSLLLDLGVLLSLVIQCLFAEKMEEKEGRWFFSVICGLFNNVIGVPLKLGISVLLVDSLMRKFRHS